MTGRGRRGGEISMSPKFTNHTNPDSSRDALAIAVVTDRSRARADALARRAVGDETRATRSASRRSFG